MKKPENPLGNTRGKRRRRRRFPSDQSLFVAVAILLHFLDHRNFFFPLKTTQSNCPLPSSLLPSLPYEDGRPHALLLAPAAVVTGGVVKGIESRGRWRARDSLCLRRSREAEASLLQVSTDGLTSAGLVSLIKDTDSKSVVKRDPRVGRIKFHFSPQVSGAIALFLFLLLMGAVTRVNTADSSCICIMSRND